MATRLLHPVRSALRRIGLVKQSGIEAAQPRRLPRLLHALRIATLTTGLALLLTSMLGSLRAQSGNPNGAQSAATRNQRATTPLTGQSNPPAALQFAAAIIPPSAPSAEPPPAVHLARIKDIATIEGIRDNQLVGYGIVVGLHGTGDSQQTAFPIQTLAATLLRMGVSVPAASIKVQNLAAVFISATLPPFSRPGTKLDVTAASAGDATSLEGGLLLMTPLYGPDGKIYAQAEGPLVVGGYSVTLNGNTRQMNHPTTARVPGGGIVERGLSLDISARQNFSVLLNEEDFRSAGAMAQAINRELERPAAHALDSRRVDLEIAPGEDVPTLLARVEAIEVPFYPRAKVVVNERTGTVVIGGTVVLQPVSILHGGLAINVVSEFQVSQPNPFGGGTTQLVQQSRVEARDKPVNRIELRQGATVDDLVRSLQAIGATARDVISILQAMKAAGALEAEIEVL
jgi:flagellar P-ring protein FlgI